MVYALEILSDKKGSSPLSTLKKPLLTPMHKWIWNLCHCYTKLVLNNKFELKAIEIGNQYLAYERAGATLASEA